MRVCVIRVCVCVCVCVIRVCARVCVWLCMRVPTSLKGSCPMSCSPIMTMRVCVAVYACTHLPEGELSHELQPHHDHACDPEEEDVVPRLEQRPRVEGAQLRRLQPTRMRTSATVRFGALRVH